EELALLHRVFDGYAERVIEGGGPNDLLAVFRILVWLDPGRAIALLGQEGLGPWMPTNIRLELGRRLIRETYDEARDVLAAIPDTNVRSYACSESSVALSDSARPRKLELLNESLIAARAVADPAERVLRLADIGERLFDLGQTAEATKLLREGQT